MESATDARAHVVSELEEVEELEEEEIDEERTATPRPRRGERETIENYPLPAIFIELAGDNAPTLIEIKTVYVYKKTPSRKLSYINWFPITECDEPEKLLELCGPGTYCVQGRGIGRDNNIRQVYLSVGDEIEGPTYAHRAQLERTGSAKLNFTDLVSAAVAAATPLLGLWEGISEKREAQRAAERQEERERREAERTREDARNQTFMESMTKLMGARMTDLEALLKAQQAAGGASSANGNKLQDAYQTGQTDTLELIRMVKEEGLGGEDLESKIVDLIGSFAKGRQQGEEDANAHQKANGAT